MTDISIFNAIGDAILGAAIIYAAYQVRDHRKIAALYVVMAIAFFASAIAFARELILFDFYLVSAIRMLAFSVLFVEVTKYMVKGFEKIRLAYLLYASNIVFAFTSPLDIVMAYAVVFVVSNIILITAFAFLLVAKRGHTRIFSFLGLISVILNFALLSTEISVIFVPWKILFLPGRILLIIFFVGFAYHVHCNPYRFYDHGCVKFRKRGKKK